MPFVMYSDKKVNGIWCLDEMCFDNHNSAKTITFLYKITNFNEML